MTKSYNLKDISEKLIYRGIVKRAKKEGLISSERELLNKKTLDAVIANEDVKLSVSRFNNNILYPINVTGSGILSLPAYDSFPSWMYNNNFNSRYIGPETEFHLACPEILGAAASLVVLVTGYSLARSYWFDRREKFTTPENIKRLTKETIMN